MSVKFLGTGFYVPQNVVTNDDLAKMVDTSDEWIKQRVGVCKRHISTGETASDMAIRASFDALSDAGVKAEELDLIIAATITSETLCPTVAGYVQKAIGANCPAFDISSACSGFMFALETAVSFITGRGYKKILVIGAERVSKIVDWKDRGTCVIFGDGAGAAVVAAGENYLSSIISTQAGDEVIKIPSFKGNSPFFNGGENNPYIFMDGQETFKFAVNKIVNDIKNVAEKAKITLDQIDYIVPHQANIRIIEYASKRLKIPMEKFFVNIDKYGNTSAASIPMALSELAHSGKLKRGDIVVLSAFGGGLSSAACIIKW